MPNVPQTQFLPPAFQPELGWAPGTPVPDRELAGELFFTPEEQADGYWTEAELRAMYLDYDEDCPDGAWDADEFEWETR